LNKIVISGPESSGKTTLFEELCASLAINGVTEYARDYINGLDRAYNYQDLLEIAKGQFNYEQNMLKSNSCLILTDTDLLTLEIWCEFKYGKCHPFILDKLRINLPDFYLLCYPDIPWEFDPQRENPSDRLGLFNIYEDKIKSIGVDYQIIKGEKSDRLKSAKTIIKNIGYS
jgi:NadR type nicotinamide-nucleotide adenylyltransferase